MKGKTLSILLSSLVLSGCTSFNSCEELSNVAKTELFKAQASKFINKNTSNLTEQDVLSGGGMVPGTYQFQSTNFNWEAVNYLKNCRKFVLLEH